MYAPDDQNPRTGWPKSGLSKLVRQSDLACNPGVLGRLATTNPASSGTRVLVCLTSPPFSIRRHISRNLKYRQKTRFPPAREGLRGKCLIVLGEQRHHNSLFMFFFAAVIKAYPQVRTGIWIHTRNLPQAWRARTLFSSFFFFF